MYEHAQEAAKIHTSLGGQVSIASDVEGRMHYVMSAENWTEWAKIGEKLDASEAWQKFGAKLGKESAATREATYMLNSVSAGGAGEVYQVNVWKPAQLGGTQALVATALEAEKIHEKAGADVAVLVDQMGLMHYVVSFDSWAEWAKFADTPNPEFQEFMRRAAEDPKGELVKVYRGSNL